MTTHAIGVNKANISTTFDQRTARILGRIAASSGMSRNEWVRHAVTGELQRANSGRLSAAVGSPVKVIVVVVKGGEAGSNNIRGGEAGA